MTIELEIGRTIRSVWRDLADYDRVVVAAGAASTSIGERMDGNGGAGCRVPNGSAALGTPSHNSGAMEGSV